MKKALPLFFLFLLSFCSKRESQYPRLIVPEVDDVVEVNSKLMLQSQPPLLAQNFSNDTLGTKYKYFSGRTNSIYVSMDSVTPKYNLKIIIDTSYNFHSNGMIYERNDYPQISTAESQKYMPDEMKIPSVKKYFDRIEFLKKNYIASFPVLIYNNSTKKALVSKGSYGDFILIQEAKDIDGKWKPIEFRFWMENCIPGSFDFVLNPRKYIATSIIKYHGNFKTKIRVKFYSRHEIYYSNEINGFINRSQFNQDFCKEFLKSRPLFSEEYFESDKKMMFLNSKF